MWILDWQINLDSLKQYLLGQSHRTDNIFQPFYISETYTKYLDDDELDKVFNIIETACKRNGVKFEDNKPLVIGVYEDL